MLSACTAFPAAAPGGDFIAVVQGTSSVPNAAERGYAAAVARRMAHWLTELDVPFRLMTDEDLATGRAQAASVVILTYNPVLGPRGWMAVRTLLLRGGKLVVFYSSDDRLASLMGFELGKYKSSRAFGRWSEIEFTGEAPRHVPPLVRQNSRNVRVLKPAAAHSRVIAYWRDAEGRRSGDPAWLQSNAGFWMTHVLLDDGDTERKKQMLLALLGALSPSVWPPAARHALLECGRIGLGDGVPETAAAIRRRAAGKPGAGNVEEALTRALAAYGEGRRAYRQGDGGRAFGHAVTARQALTEAYGWAQDPAPHDLLGVWDQGGIGLYPGDWNRTASVLAGMGVTDLFVNFLRPGVAHFRSRHLAASDEFREHGDQVQDCRQAAARHGLRVHAWKVFWKIDRAPERLVQRLREQGRLQRSADGREIPWLCPSHDANAQMEKDAVRELVRRYAVDGVHLDYVRFPDRESCFCSTCRTAFEAHFGRSVAHWPEDVRSGIHADAFHQWRVRIITRTVRDVAALVRDMRPETRISAAVYGSYPSCIRSVGQDWGAWLSDGTVDFVCPMNYTADLSQFKLLVERQAMLPGARGRLFPGIGVTAAQSRLHAVQVIDQIAATRAIGLRGAVLFDLNRVLEHEVLPILGNGMFSRR